MSSFSVYRTINICDPGTIGYALDLRLRSRVQIHYSGYTFMLEVEGSGETPRFAFREPWRILISEYFGGSSDRSQCRRRLAGELYAMSTRLQPAPSPGVRITAAKAANTFRETEKALLAQLEKSIKLAYDIEQGKMDLSITTIDGWISEARHTASSCQSSLKWCKTAGVPERDVRIMSGIIKALEERLGNKLRDLAAAAYLKQTAAALTGKIANGSARWLDIFLWEKEALATVHGCQDRPEASKEDSPWRARLIELEKSRLLDLQARHKAARTIQKAFRSIIAHKIFLLDTSFSSATHSTVYRLADNKQYLLVRDPGMRITKVRLCIKGKRIEKLIRQAGGARGEQKTLVAQNKHIVELEVNPEYQRVPPTDGKSIRWYKDINPLALPSHYLTWQVDKTALIAAYAGEPLYKEAGGALMVAKKSPFTLESFRRPLSETKYMNQNGFFNYDWKGENLAWSEGPQGADAPARLGVIDCDLDSLDMPDGFGTYFSTYRPWFLDSWLAPSVQIGRLAAMRQAYVLIITIVEVMTLQHAELSASELYKLRMEFLAYAKSSPAGPIKYPRVRDALLAWINKNVTNGNDKQTYRTLMLGNAVSLFDSPSLVPHVHDALWRAPSAAGTSTAAPAQ